MDLFEMLAEALRPEEPIWRQQLATGVEKYAAIKYEERLGQLYYPECIVLPMTPEGEEQRDWLMDYQFNDKGVLINQSVFRYGCDEVEFYYDGDTYIALLINGD